MPSEAMVVDVVPYKWFGVVAALASALLVAALLIGGLGMVVVAAKTPISSHKHHSMLQRAPQTSAHIVNGSDDFW
jgi:hypothetical protein